MAAVLRVKRKAASSPEEMLIISRKRQKTESSSDAEETITEQTILHFAGTIKDLNEDIAQYVTNVLPNLEEKAKSGTKRTLPCDSKTSNVPGKVSRLTKLDSITDRFKVVNCQRSVDVLSKESSEDKWMTLIDIEDSWNISKTSEDGKEVISSGNITDIDNIEKKEEIKKEDMEEYVYDLYYAQTCNDVWSENSQIMIQHPEYLVPEQYSDEDKSTIDSNSESHWRNDYPDSETSDDSASSPEFYSDYDAYKEENYDEFEADMCNVLVDLEQLHTVIAKSYEEISESDSDESFGIL